MTTSAGHQYRSELFRKLAAEAEMRAAEAEERGEARGEARGESNAVLTVLEARGVLVPMEVSKRIVACTDSAQLQVWLRRAVTANTAYDVIGE